MDTYQMTDEEDALFRHISSVITSAIYTDEGLKRAPKSIITHQLWLTDILSPDNIKNIKQEFETYIDKHFPENLNDICKSMYYHAVYGSVSQSVKLKYNEKDQSYSIYFVPTNVVRSEFDITNENRQNIQDEIITLFYDELTELLHTLIVLHKRNVTRPVGEWLDWRERQIKYRHMSPDTRDTFGDLFDAL